ncbi:hypothetical protein Bca52824_016691 [Brassica carinata]|uniref:Uncharacterized protein n=1 Tax=Brassica carinata TaxID=52824 RepID=A0A8X7W413_BRACI|nr:hypothetical protein Bca52824_016691 [Brassica carinata]
MDLWSDHGVSTDLSSPVTLICLVRPSLVGSGGACLGVGSICADLVLLVCFGDGWCFGGFSSLYWCLGDSGSLSRSSRTLWAWLARRASDLKFLGGVKSFLRWRVSLKGRFRRVEVSGTQVSAVWSSFSCLCSLQFAAVVF